MRRRVGDGNARIADRPPYRQARAVRRLGCVLASNSKPRRSPGVGEAANLRMADRSNHYERAFEAYLRAARVSCIPVDETRRTFFAERQIKSLDFIVLSGSGAPLLVDVKGRKWGGGTRLESWATREDVESLLLWKQSFGPEAVALLAFVYLIADEPTADDELPPGNAFEYDDRRYRCLAIDVDAYQVVMKARSPRWETVDLAAPWQLALARPFAFWL